MDAFRIAFLILVGMLLVAALVRWARTPETHPENGARGDMARLLGLILLAMLGDVVRSRFLPASPAFWASSVLLVALVGMALLLVRRLLTVYRETNSGKGTRR